MTLSIFPMYVKWKHLVVDANSIDRRWINLNRLFLYTHDDFFPSSYQHASAFCVVLIDGIYVYEMHSNSQVCWTLTGHAATPSQIHKCSECYRKVYRYGLLFIFGVQGDDWETCTCATNCYVLLFYGFRWVVWDAIAWMTCSSKPCLPCDFWMRFLVSLMFNSSNYK